MIVATVAMFAILGPLWLVCREEYDSYLTPLHFLNFGLKKNLLKYNNVIQLKRMSFQNAFFILKIQKVSCDSLIYLLSLYFAQLVNCHLIKGDKDIVFKVNKTTFI